MKPTARTNDASATLHIKMRTTENVAASRRMVNHVMTRRTGRKTVRRKTQSRLTAITLPLS